MSAYCTGAELRLLQQVRQKVAAHKAVMITNTGFTAGAIAAAKDGGIALHGVRPLLDDLLSPSCSSPWQIGLHARPLPPRSSTSLPGSRRA